VLCAKLQRCFGEWRSKGKEERSPVHVKSTGVRFVATMAFDPKNHQNGDSARLRFGVFLLGSGTPTPIQEILVCA
jgi:hypothetical protein